MFEANEDDIDVDDEFLNIVFEDEERQKNLNVPPRVEKINSSTPLIKTHSIREHGRDVPDHSGRYDSFSPKDTYNLSPSISENKLPFSVHADNALQPGTNSGNKENKRKQATPPHSRSKRERRFPGPAGLLPDRKSSRSTPLKLDNFLEVESPTLSSTEELCSQGRLSGTVLEEEPWQSLLSDLGPHRDVLDMVNVASVKRKAAARCFVGNKVPFLAVVLHHLDVSSPDPCVILRDCTGEIHGTLHREVWQQFAAELVVGCVLVIKNVGLLSTGTSSRRHYLNITANNLATIYPVNPEKPLKRELHPLTSRDFVRTIENWRSLVAPPRTVASPASPALFNSSLSSSSTSSSTQSPLMHNIRHQLNGLRHSSVPHAQNMRPTSQSVQGIDSLQRMPQNPRSAPPRTMGKNLFPSSTKASNPNPIHSLRNNVNCSIPSTSTSVYNNARLPNPNLSSSNSSFNNSFSSQSLVKSHRNNVHNSQVNRVPECNSFKFDPVMLKTKTFTPTDIFPQRNFEPAAFESNKHSLGKNNQCVILSQSSQLTKEEQSVVESVFDGIDADSLFDDDF